MVNPRITQLRKRQEIVILGSYSPEENKDQLLKVKKELREEGLPKTDLVIDRKINFKTTGLTDDQINYKKSIQAILKSDIAIYVLTLNGAPGPHIEFTEASHQREFCEKTIICIQVDKERGINALSSLHRGIMEICKRIEVVEFEEGEDFMNELLKRIDGIIIRKNYKRR